MSGWPYEFPAALSADLDDAGLPAEDFRVMLHACRRCGDGSNGRVCDSSVASMATVCRLNPDTVRRSLKRLVDLGWLSATERAGKTTAYQPRFPHPSTETPPVQLSTPPLKQEGLCLEGVDPSGFKGVHPSSFRGAEGKPLREPKKGKSPTEILLPFESEPFAEAWKDWQQHRTEKRKPITPTSATKTLANLSKMGEARAIAAINHSIANGWQGIFEPSDTPATPAVAGTVVAGRVFKS